MRKDKRDFVTLVIEKSQVCNTKIILNRWNNTIREGTNILFKNIRERRHQPKGGGKSPKNINACYKNNFNTTYDEVNKILKGITIINVD